MKSNKTRVTISLPKEIHEQGKQMAREDRRAFSAFLAVTIEDKWRELKGTK